MLRSTDTVDYILPRTRTKFGQHCICFSGPSACNSLLSNVHDVNDTNVLKWLKCTAHIDDLCGIPKRCVEQSPF